MFKTETKAQRGLILAPDQPSQESISASSDCRTLEDYSTTFRTI